MRAPSSFAATADGLEPKRESWPGDIGSKYGRPASTETLRRRLRIGNPVAPAFPFDFGRNAHISPDSSNCERPSQWVALMGCVEV